MLVCECGVLGEESEDLGNFSPASGGKKNAAPGPRERAVARVERLNTVPEKPRASSPGSGSGHTDPGGASERAARPVCGDSKPGPRNSGTLRLRRDSRPGLGGGPWKCPERFERALREPPAPLGATKRVKVYFPLDCSEKPPRTEANPAPWARWEGAAKVGGGDGPRPSRPGHPAT